MTKIIIQPVASDLDRLRAAIPSSLISGNAAEAREMLAEATALGATAADGADWAQFYDINAWPDAWLVATVRRDPPDEAALDALVRRYWKALFARCQMMTLNSQKASDFAQESWCRVLRARHLLKPDGNFPAYLLTIATNLWRDSCRSAKRAGPMAEGRMASLDAEIPSDSGESGKLADILPDLNALHPAERTLLKLDIDEALGRLDTLLHDVLVARYIAGESCAEIGLRYGRTEQTVSAWVREGIRQMKNYLQDSRVCNPEVVTE
jgi:RNA polymerase sigma factor (sigma-70 family)